MILIDRENIPSNLPIHIIRPKLEIPKEYLYHRLVQQYLLHDPIKGGGYNFIAFSDPSLAKLYDEMELSVIDLFGPLKILPNSNRNIWAYVSNCDHYFAVMHDHIATSLVNTVYYLNTPQSQNIYDGGISFELPNNELFYFQPKQGDLIIMPNWLKHRPHEPLSQIFRISINMEIQCEIPWGNKSSWYN